MWKSCLFPRMQSSFRVRCWVPMKRLQQSCMKLKLCTGLATRAAYLKPRPQHPVSVESNSLRQEWVNKCLKHMLEFDSTAAVQLSWGCFVLRCHTRRRLCGWEPPGPDPHTTWRFSSARPRITLGYSRDKRNRKWPQMKSLMGNVSSTHEVVYFHDFIILEGHYLDSVRSHHHWVNMKTQWNAGTNRARVEARRYSY